MIFILTDIPTYKIYRMIDDMSLSVEEMREQLREWREDNSRYGTGNDAHFSAMAKF
jgi:hypothetical protein